MKRVIALVTLVTIMVITAGAVRTPAQNYYGYNVDNDYGGELPDEPMWTINFYLDDVLYYGTYNEESLKDYVIEYHDKLMSECGEYDTYVFIEPSTLHYYYKGR